MKPGPTLEECHRTFPDSQKENGRVSVQEASIEGARPESQAWLSGARHHGGPGLTATAGCRARPAAAPASAAVTHKRCSGQRALLWGRPCQGCRDLARLQGDLARLQGDLARLP
jgi:hypothetical protein